MGQLHSSFLDLERVELTFVELVGSAEEVSTEFLDSLGTDIVQTDDEES